MERAGITERSQSAAFSEQRAFVLYSFRFS